MESEKGEIQDRQIIFEIIDNLLKKEGMTEERAQAILNVSAAILPELALITKAYVMGMKASNK